MDRINQVVKLLSDNENSIVEYLKETQFDYSVLDSESYEDIENKVVYYDFLNPNSLVKNKTIKELISYEFVTHVSYNIFLPGTKIDKHKDPKPGDEIYQKAHHHGVFSGNPEYRRLHFTIEDSPKNCFMIFDNVKYTWKKGQVQFFDVHNFVHEFVNNSDDLFSLLLIDVLVGE